MLNNKELEMQELTEQETEKIIAGLGFGDTCPKCGKKIKVMKNDFKGHLLCKNCGAVLSTYEKQKAVRLSDDPDFITGASITEEPGHEWWRYRDI